MGQIHEGGFGDLEKWRTKRRIIGVASREKPRTGRPWGNADFMEKAEEVTGRWLKPRRAGRPKKKKK
ncbi:MAG: hypothetical protein C4532_08530 [Candidatus Abyssobacteria bacterium SURF_17]|uniref:Uncharacterized protein n=1 Tax=Candidatus Abyssobacteria bacterium SURF_17 TaxID=2093361 RepID=A0A419EZQ6_9BACT|nr:MAG: hypothetical protein C4532_08530 [Candidatus Abyssubacteria bacterium SURF_17]